MTAIPPDARALTIRQPWASLIALGVKTIETRSWSTAYRGPLVIHAGKAWGLRGLATTALIDRFLHENDIGCFADDEWTHPPLGAVVAVVDLVDVVPIVDMPKYEVDTRLTNPAVDRPYATLPPTYICGNERVEGPALWLVENGGRYISQTPFSVTEQLPYGDFTPGRYAWLLDNVRPVDPPTPAKGRQGLWKWDQ